MAIVRSFLAVAALASTVLAQAEIKPPVGVVQDGVPSIPASMRLKVNPYRAFYPSSLLAWDSSKTEIYVTRYQRTSVQAARVTSPGAPLNFLTDFPDGVAGFYYHTDGKYFIYRKPEGGSELYQLYRYDVQSKRSTRLTDGRSKNLYPVWVDSGNKLIYSSTRRNGKDMDLYEIDPVDPSTNRMLAKLDGEDWAAFDCSPDGRQILLSDYKSPNESYLWLLDVNRGEKSLLTPAPKGEKVFNGSYGYFSKDGKGIYIITDRGSEFRRLAFLDLATKNLRFLTGDDWDVEELALSPDGATIAFTTNENGQGRLHLLEARTYKESSVPTLPIGVASGLAWHNNSRYLGFVFTSTRSPGEVYSVDLHNGKLEQWTRSYSGINTDRFVDPELIKWRSFDGRIISGFLYRPPSTFTGKRPVIIDIHGGPYLQFRPYFRWDDNYITNELGITMIYPNIRGSAGYGKSFLTLDDGFHREDAVRDVGELLDWIKTQPTLDCTRVAISGASYGGYVALSAAIKYPDRISAVLSYVGITNLVTFIKDASSNEPDAWRREYGDERDTKTRNFLESIAPSNNASKIRKASLLAVGGKDEKTSVTETASIVATLKKNGIPAWYIVANDEAHGFTTPLAYEYMFFSKIAFIQSYLLTGS